MTSTFLTVAIPYVNADPHLGYAYELVLADIHARARRLGGADTRFLGGTDDYSLKNVLAAEEAGQDTGEFVRTKAARFRALAGPLDLSFDDFIHTSDDARHLPAVHSLWNAALAAGDLYRRAYTGDYCIGCERFYTPEELEDGCCPEHRRPVERVEEENWFFRLSRYQDLLDELITTDTVRITPAPFKNEILAFIRRGLDDISVSRSQARARGWGIPVPGDPDQVVYVWFDALTNYISSLGFGGDAADHERWWCRADERTHVIGKGILRFHAVYWPAFLASAGQPLPTHIRVHPYLTVGQLKLSKSSGTTVDPSWVANTFGTDAIRWWFAREVAETADTDFTVERLVARVNEDLAGGVGNVISRITTLVHRFRDGIPPQTVRPLPHVQDELAVHVRRLIGEFELRKATQAIVDAVAALNADLESTEPWKLGADRERVEDFDVVIARQLRAAIAIASALAPITPTLAAEAQRQLTGSPALPAPVPLVPRLEA